MMNSGDSAKETLKETVTAEAKAMLDRLVYGNDGYLVPCISLALFTLCLFVNFTRGYKSGAVSHKYNLRVVPPDFAFAIWGVIYLCTGITLGWACWTHAWTFNTHFWFQLYCVLNTAYIYTWTRGDRISVNCSWAILFALCMCQYQLWESSAITSENIKSYFFSNPMYLFMRQTLAFQLGWIIPAFFLNFTQFLVYGLKLQ